MRAPPFPTKKDVDRVMALVPFRSITGETEDEEARRRSDCRIAVAATLRQLRGYNPTPIGKARRQAEKYARKLSSANAALVELGRLASSATPFFSVLEYERQEEMLDRLRQQTDEFLTNEWVWPPKTTKPAVARAQLAACRAFFLLMDFWNVNPTTTQGGHWHRLTNLLCASAFGKTQRDILRTCRGVLPGLTVMEDARKVQRALSARELFLRLVNAWRTPTLTELGWNDDWRRLHHETCELA
jgi:hypothetical protein